MKNKRYKKQREKGTIRIGDVMFIVTGEEYAEYYAELERKKYSDVKKKAEKYLTRKHLKTAYQLNDYLQIHQYLLRKR